MNFILLLICIGIVFCFVYSAVMFKKDIKRSEKIKEFYLSKLSKFEDTENLENDEVN